MLLRKLRQCDKNKIVDVQNDDREIGVNEDSRPILDLPPAETDENSFRMFFPYLPAFWVTGQRKNQWDCWSSVARLLPKDPVCEPAVRPPVLRKLHDVDSGVAFANP